MNPQYIEHHEIDKIPNINQLDQCTTLDMALNWFTTHKHLRLAQNHHSWIMPQLVSKFQQWQVEYDHSGQPSGLLTAQLNLEDPKQRRYWWMMRVPRGNLVANQNQNPHYAQITPLVLLAHKPTIAYSRWVDTNLVLEPWLVLATTLNQAQRVLLQNLDPQHKQLQHAHSLQGKPARGQTKVFRVQGTPWQEFTPQCLVLLLQHWLACPSVRHQNQILDPHNWDLVPEPIVCTEVTVTKPTQPLPWLR